MTLGFERIMTEARGVRIFGSVGVSRKKPTPSVIQEDREGLCRERQAIALLPPVPSGGSDAPNVLPVALDTVRTDHLSLYEGEQPSDLESDPMESRNRAASPGSRAILDRF